MRFNSKQCWSRLLRILAMAGWYGDWKRDEPGLPTWLFVFHASLTRHTFLKCKARSTPNDIMPPVVLCLIASPSQRNRHPNVFPKSLARKIEFYNHVPVVHSFLKDGDGSNSLYYPESWRMREVQFNHFKCPAHLRSDFIESGWTSRHATASLALTILVFHE